jgi:hypothetical protein
MLNLLWAVAAIFLALWLLGMKLHVAAGSLIHVLLAMAIIAVLVRIIVGHRIA